MSSRRPFARLLPILVLLAAAGCAGGSERPSGTYVADSDGSVIRLDFHGESDVAVTLGPSVDQLLFSRVCSYTQDGDHVVISDPGMAKAMELELDGDSLVGAGVVFEKQ